MIVETGLDGLGPTPGEKDLILATTLPGSKPIGLEVSDQDPNCADPTGLLENTYTPGFRSVVTDSAGFTGKLDTPKPRSDVTPSTVGSTPTDSTDSGVSQEKG